MSKQMFDFLVYTGSILGVLLALPLLFGRKNPPRTILGIYTLLLTVSFIEPVTKSGNSILSSAAGIVIGTASFMLGPVLYLYCKARAHNIQKWKMSYLVHFIPSGIIFLLMTYSTIFYPAAEEGVAEMVIYGFFVIYLITYSVESLMVILRKRKTPTTYQEKIQWIFLLFLSSTSLALFAFSTLYTLLGFGLSYTFVIAVQLILFFIIMAISLLNPEASKTEPLR
jgi:hypothetical protein